MATSLFSSPPKPHFFQPLLPGFKTHLSIPVAFYSKHLEGKEEGNAVTLISDASEITWKITLDGRRLINGWVKFAVAHSLKVGDILVFRHEGNLMFHVTPLGLSCCEILYSHDDDNHTEKVIRNSKVKKKNPIKDETCYVVPVTDSNLKADSLTLPKGFTTSSGLSTLCNEIILIYEKGSSSTLEFVYHRSSGRFCIRRGWRAFCCTNGQKSGGFLRFKLVSNGKTPVLRFFPLGRDEDNTGDPESAEENKNVGSHESVMKEKENMRSLESTEERVLLMNETLKGKGV
ncbi:unnamed protein product [Arabis nemorensis]|uniref:TF-B3 domain-containing protein n=1 Tax=Arabis nemorensis TaxID=586526 RepID=A0A565BJZ0_9BRAS|nr:unnamed protein product [Arabis nemorensis]